MLHADVIFKDTGSLVIDCPNYTTDVLCALASHPPQSEAAWKDFILQATVQQHSMMCQQCDILEHPEYQASLLRSNKRAGLEN